MYSGRKKEDSGIWDLQILRPRNDDTYHTNLNKAILKFKKILNFFLKILNNFMFSKSSLHFWNSVLDPSEHASFEKAIEASIVCIQQ